MNAVSSLQKALNEIHFYKNVVPVKAYEVVAEHREEVTPYLIQVLKDTIQKCDHTGDYYVAHIHALLLLSQFREKQAYPVVLELLNLPIDSIDRLLGDLLTETIPKVITSIYNGNPEPLFALLTNRETDKILRLVIGGCFSALIYQKLIAKEMVLLRLQEIVASGKMNNDPGFFTAIARLTMESKLEPLYDTIRAAFKTDMVDNEYMNIHIFEKELLLPIEQTNRIEDLNPLVDAATELAKWYGNPEDRPITVKIERNAPCPCGSGLKFKKCCIKRL